jgi:phosphoadenosine phosphosulfate reductase
LALTDKIQHSIDLIKKHESFALNLNPDGYYLAFSGGKDSQVIYELCKIAGVKFVAHLSCTTRDPKEVLHFIRKYYPDVIWHRPEKSFTKLIEENRSLPLRQSPYCCRLIKEVGGTNQLVINGVRKAEGGKRRNRDDGVNHVCIMGEDKFVISPIVNWTTNDVWTFVRTQIGYYCELYDKGYHRIGCIMCPNASPKIKQKQDRDFPRFKLPIIKGIIKCIEYGNYKEFDDAEDVYAWWISGVPKNEWLANKKQGKLNM